MFGLGKLSLGAFEDWENSGRLHDKQGDCVESETGVSFCCDDYKKDQELHG
jgi:hypothetical protein